MTDSNTDIVPFPEKIIVSCVTKNKGPLTKIMRIDPKTGLLVKDGSECSMYTGHIKKIPVSSPTGFKKMLRTRTANQAIVHGVSQHDEALVVVKSKVGSYPKNGTPVIARSKDHITYSDGPGVILFDHDKARDLSTGADKALKAYSPEGLISCLATVHPDIANSAYVSTPSTSSCIYSAVGEMLRGEGSGSHVYQFVKCATDIPRYMEVFGKHLFLAGFGRIEISRSGALLIRTLIDLVVASPERLDFVAGAVCEDGLVQQLPEPVVKNGALLDTSTLPKLTDEEEARYLETVAALKLEAKPEQEKVVAEYVERESGKLAQEKGITIDAARPIVVSRQDHVLQDDDILFFSHKKDGVSVREILDNPDDYNGKSLADPLEPEYENFSKTKAKFYWNEGLPVINSFCHGSVKYTFARFPNQEADRDVSNSEKEMFDRFVFLASENKIIDTWGNDIKDSTMIERAFTISQAGSFKTITDQDGNEKAIPMTQYWLSADSKKIAYSLRYRPGQKLLFENGDGRTYYNTFRFPFSSREPMAVPEQEKRLGSWNKIMDTVFHEHRSYIEDFFSFSIQFPEKRAGIMPVCISDVGLGKSLVMAIVSRVIGSHNFSNAKILDVTGLGKSGTQWGDWIFNKKISCIEEIDPEGETGISYKILDALKDIITNETLSLNLKGGKNGTFRVYSNIIGFSNHHNCVKIPYGDRRLFIVDSTGQDLLSKQEYVELWDWIMDKQNSFAVFQYLLKRKISDEFIPGQAKMTKAKLALQVDGRSTLQQAFDLVVNDYPSDLITSGELQLAVADAMNLIDDSGTDHRAINWNSEKQFQAIMKTTTTLINGGKRLKVRRHGSSDSKACTVRALRNGQDWSGATPNEIRDAMFIEIPWKWIPESRELEVPF